MSSIQYSVGVFNQGRKTSKKKMFVFLDPAHTPPIRECYKHLLPLQQDSNAACVYLLQFLSLHSL